MTIAEAHELVAAECQKRGHEWGKDRPYRDPANTLPPHDPFKRGMHYMGKGAWLVTMPSLSWYDARNDAPHQIRRRRAA